MAKKKPSATIATNGAYVSNAVHTIELAELFSVLRSARLESNSTAHDLPSEWNGNMTWHAALDAAELGKWNAPTIETLTIPQIHGEREDFNCYYDVTGNVLDVAMFVNGEPEYWQNIEPIRKPCSCVIRLAVEIGGAWTITAASMTNRGRALIALINSLELAGNSVELTLSCAFLDTFERTYKFLIPIKHAGLALDMKRLQFIIGAPAFFRKCIFALYEIAQGASLHKYDVRPRTFNPTGYTFMDRYQGLCESIEESMQWAKTFADSLTLETITAS